MARYRSSIDTALASITHQRLVDIGTAMEKSQKLLGVDELPLRQQDAAPLRRSKRSDHAIVAVLIFFLATCWFTTVGPAFTIGRHGCKHKLTVEQRAARILKEHPLIGQHCRTLPYRSVY